MIPRLRLVPTPRLILVQAPARPPLFDLLSWAPMWAATDAIGEIADKVDRDLPGLVDRIKQIGAA